MSAPGGAGGSGDRAELRASDERARQLAQRQFDAPLVVEAGAGTGKTATLVARVLAWCLGPGWERARAELPEAEPVELAERVARGVVAITFTEAAAAEMDARISSALAQLAAGRDPVGFDAAAPAERVAALGQVLDQLVVQTIHAYCRRLLAAHPLEAGVHPLFEVDAEASAREEVVREVVAERLAEGYGARDPALLALAERGAGPGEVERALSAQLGAGASSRELGRDPLSAARIEALWERVTRAHRALAEAADCELGVAKASRRAASVQAALAAGLVILGQVGADVRELAPRIESLLALWEPARNALREWRRGRFQRGELDAFGGRLENVSEAAGQLDACLAHLGALDPPALAHLAPLLGTLAKRVEERLNRRGRLGFDELLSRASELLRRREVAGRVRSRIDQLLVDEFQDTDPRQCAIVAELALSGPAESRPGLFLVGDPKQSIYGWRSADLAAYEGLLERARAAGGRVESLCVNHRSVPAVLDAVELAIAPVMRRDPGLQPSFRGLAPSPALENDPGFGELGRTPVEFWIPAACDADGVPQTTRASEAAEIEAAALARDLRELHEGAGVAWGDVGLLFRSRGEWDIYLGALRAAEIPYRVEGDRSYYRRREIQDAAALVCAVLDPADTLSLVTLLRSTLSGVPDAAWIALWEGGLPERAARLGADDGAPAELRALLDRVAARLGGSQLAPARVEGWQHAAGDCLEAIATLRRHFECEAGDRFVERLRELTAFETVEAGRFLGRWRRANLERFFSICAAELAEPGSPDALLRRLRRAVAEEEVPSLEPAVLDADDAVSVVTLHGAKGLAWEHVYLLQLHKGEAHQSPRDAAGWCDGRFEARWCGWPTLGCDGLEERRRRVAEAERVRTLYVGMTRARRRLVLSGLWPGLMRAGRESHTALLGRGVGRGVDLAALASAADAGGRARHGSLEFLFPGLAPLPGTQSAPVSETRGSQSSRPEAAPGGPEPGDGGRWPASGQARGPGDPDALAPARSDRRRSTSVSALAREAVQSAAGNAPSAPVGPAREGAPDPADPLDPATARAVGSAIHAALERLDLGRPGAEAWRDQRAPLERELHQSLPEAAAAAAVRDALTLWDELAAGPLARRLAELAPRVVARELPVLLATDGAPESGAALVRGSIDLLYREANGRWVVVDYKTDRPGTGGRDYARQGFLYAAALKRALALERAPGFELWWLRSGEIERVAPRP